MMDINIYDTEIFPYLEGEALVGKTLPLTIRDIKIEEMKSHKGKKEQKYVLYFKENCKGFVLNKTNAKRIAMHHGPTTGAWQGKQITLCTEKVQAFGETHNALRVVEATAPSGDEMNLFKLLGLLKKVEVPGMAGFYEFPDDIKACRAKNAPLPAADDVEGWRNLFVDARDYAIDRINEAVERGDVSPDDLTLTPTQLSALDEAERGDVSPDQIPLTQVFGQVEPGEGFVTEPPSAMDEVEADEAPF